ncbi:CDP-diacylglycerol--serine O-phosphatidyltransferase [Neisseriaceae bacterium PsAf]|nr:CDP-diacylglycerol--serine O-phosphatidyltransferase [Neisseriaceae bacterium PsAf]
MSNVTNQTGETWQEKTGFYFLPNAFTLGALFFAFFAITEAINGRYDHSGWAIIASLLLDGMDGRVARMTGKQGAFGEQLDSIADMVSFGLAPALIVYMALLNNFGKFGYMVAFIYAACAALRLALFNTLVDTADKKWFTGLPSPSAASIVVGYVWMWFEYFPDYEYAGQIAILVTLFAGLSMIAPVKFWSFKGIESKKVQNYNNWFILAMLLLLVATETPIVYFSFFFLYALISYLWALKRYIEGAREFPI